MDANAPIDGIAWMNTKLADPAWRKFRCVNGLHLSDTDQRSVCVPCLRGLHRDCTKRAPKSQFARLLVRLARRPLAPCACALTTPTHSAHRDERAFDIQFGPTDANAPCAICDAPTRSPTRSGIGPLCTAWGIGGHGQPRKIQGSKP